MSEPHNCTDYCPPEWAGHWKDWHKGHGCDIEARAEEQARHPERPGVPTTALEKHLAGHLRALAIALGDPSLPDSALEPRIRLLRQAVDAFWHARNISPKTGRGEAFKAAWELARSVRQPVSFPKEPPIR